MSLSLTNFQDLKSWINRFLQHKRLSVHRVTTSDRKLPSTAGAAATAFIASCRPYQEPGYDRDCLLIDNETSIYLDPDVLNTKKDDDGDENDNET